MSKKKDDKRGQIPHMKDLTFAQQNELMQRWRLRHDLRTAYPEIVAAMILWVIDNYDIAQFVAVGHQSQFNINPQDDLLYRMLANGFTDKEIQAAFDNGDAAASWMTPEELTMVVDCIAGMQKYFQTHDPGTFDQALAAYVRIGEAVRRVFIQQYGYAPEESPVPRVK